LRRILTIERRIFSTLNFLAINTGYLATVSAIIATFLRVVSSFAVAPTIAYIFRDIDMAVWKSGRRRRWLGGDRWRRWLRRILTIEWRIFSTLNFLAVNTGCLATVPSIIATFLRVVSSVAVAPTIAYIFRDINITVWKSGRRRRWLGGDWRSRRLSRIPAIESGDPANKLAIITRLGATIARIVSTLWCVVRCFSVAKAVAHIFREVDMTVWVSLWRLRGRRRRLSRIFAVEWDYSTYELAIFARSLATVSRIIATLWGVVRCFAVTPTISNVLRKLNMTIRKALRRGWRWSDDFVKLTTTNETFGGRLLLESLSIHGSEKSKGDECNSRDLHRLNVVVFVDVLFL
jgi:hypothetical protein